MCFAFTPDDAPPRLIRFAYLRGYTAALYYPESNLVVIDRDSFDRLSKERQEDVLRTHKSLRFSLE
jgi:hypothetical protein